MFEGCRKVIHKPLSIKEKGKLKTKEFQNLRQSPKPVNEKKGARPVFNIGFEGD